MGQGKRCARDDLAPSKAGAAVGESKLARGPALRSGGTHHVHPLERAGELAAVGVRVHPDCASDRAWDVDAELDAGQARLGGAG